MANEIRRIGGSLTVVRRINGTIGSQGRVGGSINRATREYATVYEGPYSVTPRLYSQSLDTDGKLMSEDVTVYEIPVTSTSNLQGGRTVVIG